MCDVCKGDDEGIDTGSLETLLEGSPDGLQVRIDGDREVGDLVGITEFDLEELAVGFADDA